MVPTPVMVKPAVDPVVFNEIPFAALLEEIDWKTNPPAPIVELARLKAVAAELLMVLTAPVTITVADPPVAIKPAPEVVVIANPPLEKLMVVPALFTRLTAGLEPVLRLLLVPENRMVPPPILPDTFIPRLVDVMVPDSVILFPVLF